LHDGDKLRIGPIKLLVQLQTTAASMPVPDAVAKSDSDDDTIVSLLLSMNEDTKTDIGSTEDAKPLREGKAVMAALSADTTVMKPAAPAPAPPSSPEKSTSAAADRILNVLSRPAAEVALRAIPKGCSPGLVHRATQRAVRAA
jgi:hypothetical protein